jgi:hypothetical protein
VKPNYGMTYTESEPNRIAREAKEHEQLREVSEAATSMGKAIAGKIDADLLGLAKPVEAEVKG